jgi:hypothetical protein
MRVSPLAHGRGILLSPPAKKPRVALMYPPMRSPTPQEYEVLFYATIISLIVAGLAAFVMAYRQPVEKHEIAILLVRIGWVSFGLAGSCLFGRWLWRRLVD